MSYKIKNKPVTIVMLSLTIFMACLGTVNIGANTPEKYPSTEGALIGVVLVLIGFGGFIAVLCMMSWNELRVTGMDKELEDEVNKRVREKMNEVINKAIELKNNL